MHLAPTTPLPHPTNAGRRAPARSGGKARNHARNACCTARLVTHRRQQLVGRGAHAQRRDWPHGQQQAGARPPQDTRAVAAARSRHARRRGARQHQRGIHRCGPAASQGRAGASPRGGRPGPAEHATPAAAAAACPHLLDAAEKCARRAPAGKLFSAGASMADMRSAAPAYRPVRRRRIWGRCQGTAPKSGRGGGGGGLHAARDSQPPARPAAPPVARVATAPAWSKAGIGMDREAWPGTRWPWGWVISSRRAGGAGTRFFDPK